MPHDFNGGAGYSSSLAVFMALNQKKLRIPYTSFDPFGNKREISLSLEFDAKVTHKFTDEERATLGQALPEL